MNDLISLPVLPSAPAARLLSASEVSFPEAPAVSRRASAVPFESIPLRVHSVEGAGGVSLSVYDAGDLYGPSILFLHGFSQSHASWRRQLESALGLGFRLVAMDLRGHGSSDKPRGVYGHGRLWAEDVQAVISTLGLERPVLVGWSYGGLVACDYLRHYGEAQVAGVHFVSALVKSGSEEGFGLLAPELLALVPGLFSEEPEAGQPALERFVSLLHGQPMTPELWSTVLAETQRVPAHVRAALGSRVVDNDDVLHRLTVPVMVTHGMEDRVVRPESSHHIASVVPGAQVSLYSGVGHSPFWEESRRFNRELAAFAARCW